MIKMFNSGARKSWGFPRTYRDDEGKLKGLPESNTWNLMHSRCDETKQVGHRPNKAYDRKKTSVCEDWFNYQNFAKWWHSVEYREEGWQLDKDILKKGNNIYSPEFCCFVPSEINTLFINNTVNRGELPLGVTWHTVNKNFIAAIRMGDRKRHHLGSFPTIEEAFECYKERKELFIKERAEEYKEYLDPRVYESMLKWEIEWTD